MRILGKTLFFLLLFIVAHTQAATDHQVKLYEEALRAYYDKDYARAEQGFLNLLEKNSCNASLLYNLGNVYFHLDEKGKALQYYEKARRLKPRMAELKTNLEMVKPHTGDDSFSSYLLKTFYFWQRLLTVSEYGLVLLVAAFAFWGMVFLRFWRKRRLASATSVLLFFLFAYVSFGFVLKSSQDATGVYGVILTKIVPLRPSYLDTDEVLFELQEGALVKVVDEQKMNETTWWRVELPQGQRGWVRAGDVGMI